MRILLNNFSVVENGLFDLCNIQVLFQPFLLSMKAIFILSFAYQGLDPFQIHNISYWNEGDIAMLSPPFIEIALKL